MFTLTYPVVYEACKKETILRENNIIKHLPRHPKVCINR